MVYLLLTLEQSYGTILGATLAAMFPERIQRAVLDGVADSHDYMAGGWSTNLRDTDILFVKFAEYCYEGGREECAIWDEDGPAVIADKIGTSFQVLIKSPIAVPGNNTQGPQIVTLNDLMRLIREM
jgi:pimeloyl-ACP methyl ester carboxylesterase